MISIRQKDLFLIVLLCLGGILYFSSQASGFVCSPEPTDDLIKYGDLVTCNINPIGDIDKFRFSGNDGDTVAVQATRQGSGGSPCIELFDPDGGLIDSKCGSTARIDVTLDQTGTHTIFVTEWYNSDTMDYVLALERIDPPSASATPINPGGLLSDAIDPVGDMDLFFFQGVNGDTVAVQATRQGSGGSPCIELFDPDGGLIDSKCGSTARIDVTLDQTGTHTILVTEWYNSDTMDYVLALERIDPPSASATPINPGGLLSDAIDPVGDMDLFFFQGVNGDTVAVQATRQGSGGSPCIELFDPDGGLIDSKCGSTARIDVTLDQTGTHTILVTEWYNSDTMDYVLALERIDPPSASATPINPGGLLSDAIDPVGDMDLFFFQGVNGDTVAVQATRQGSGGSPCIELFDPDGGLIDSKCGSTARIDVTLDQTGTHTILVTEWYNSDTMDYGLSYQCIGTCPSVVNRDRDEIIGTWSDGILYFYPPYWNSGQSRMNADTPDGDSPSGDIEAGDTNSDGYADVASCWGTGLYLQDGRTRDWELVYSMTPYRVTMANVYGDARKEVIGTFSDGVKYFYRTSSGWNITQITGYPPAGDITACDITGDGWDEVVSGYSTGTWYWNPRTGGWYQLTSAAYIPYSLACGDRNGDGRAEVVGTFHTGIWSWDRGRWSRLTDSGFATTGDMEMGDFNNNGRDDLVSCWPDGMWIQYDNGTWYKAYNIAPYRVTAGDIIGN